MNKTFKIIWSKARNCYVVASELAKRRTKAPKSRMFSKALIAGILSCVLNCGIVIPVNAAVGDHGGGAWNYSTNNVYLTYDVATGTLHLLNPSGNSSGEGDGGTDAWVVIGDVSGSGSVTRDQIISALGYIPIATDTNTTYSAGNGLALNGISVTGNGSVASGDSGLIDGSKLYTEVRPSDNGNYVKTTNTTGANLKVLDDKIGAESVANGTYIKTENTVNANLKALDLQIGALNEDGEYIQKNNNVSQNLAALDNAIDDVVNSGLQFGANSGDDVTNKIGSKVSIIGGGTKADNEYDSKNIKTIIVQDENGNTQIEIDLDKNPEFASILTEGDANIGGKLNVDGDTHLKSNLQVDGDTNLSGNTTIEKDLEVLGNSNIHGNGRGDSNLEGNTHVYQNLQVDGDTNISGNTTIEKDLTVKGDSNLEGNAHVYQNLQVDGDTNISGNTTIEKNLTVEGDSNLKGDAHIYQNLQVDGDTNLSGNTTIEKDLEVLGNSNIHGNGRRR